MLLLDTRENEHLLFYLKVRKIRAWLKFEIQGESRRSHMFLAIVGTVQPRLFHPLLFHLEIPGFFFTTTPGDNLHIVSNFLC